MVKRRSVETERRNPDPVETRICLAGPCYVMRRAQCKTKMLGTLVQQVLRIPTRRPQSLETSVRPSWARAPGRLSAREAGPVSRPLHLQTWQTCSILEPQGAAARLRCWGMTRRQLLGPESSQPAAWGKEGRQQDVSRAPDPWRGFVLPSNSSHQKQTPSLTSSSHTRLHHWQPHTPPRKANWRMLFP